MKQVFKFEQLKNWGVNKMDLLKALKRTTIISGTALLAFAATEAHAANDTSVQGHISASLQGNLTVTETSAIKFGNFSLTNCAPCTGDSNLVLNSDGGRTINNTTDTFALLVGTADGSGNDANGQPDGAGGLGTGAQAPGFYNIANTDTLTNVYVSFANSTGQIIDASHPDNFVSLSGPVASAFTVDTFTWEMDDGTTGYVGTAGTPDAYGTYAACGASCNIRVGATLRTVAGVTPTPGQYAGTYYLMVSY